jgi:ABC-type spermidine/putrescine transport system permease subunit I
MPTPTGDVVGQRRWYYPIMAVPGIGWLLVLFVLPFYAIAAVAFGQLDPIFAASAPTWNPLEWDYTAFGQIIHELVSGGESQVYFIRTLAYVSISVTLCILIGYPVAYYIARHGGRLKVLLLTLMIAPFWMSYLMRMLAWVNLLNDRADDPGLINRILVATPFFDSPVNWAAGDIAHMTVILGFVYGYVPFFVLPLYAALDRIDRSQLEAARDLGGRPASTFWRVTLPLSKQGILAGAVIIMLPMFGDYYTPDLMSAQNKTRIIGNHINFLIHGQGTAPKGASLTLLLSAFVALLMVYYLVSVARAAKEARQ